MALLDGDRFDGRFRDGVHTADVSDLMRRMVKESLLKFDGTRVGRDAGRIGEEVIAHLSGLIGARVTVTLEIAAEIPDGAPDNVVRTVTENSRTLKFTSQGFEKE